MDEDRQPLNYAKPEPSGPPAAKVLGMTAAALFLLPLGFILGLVAPLAMFACLSDVLDPHRGIAVAVFFIGLAALGVGIVYATRRSNKFMRVFFALFSIGAVFATLVLTACGFR